VLLGVVVVAGAVAAGAEVAGAGVLGVDAAGFGGGKYSGPLKPQPAESTVKESMATMPAKLRRRNLRITADSHKREDKDYERY
jgi:hypothetical protein